MIQSQLDNQSQSVSSMNRKAFVYTGGFVLTLVALAVGLLGAGHSEEALGFGVSPNRPAEGTNAIRETGHPLFCSPHFSPIAISGEHVFVVQQE